jgi:hypothetical protein
MTIREAARRIATAALFPAAISAAPLSQAQATQAVEDRDMDIRLLVPGSWSWETKSNGPFISCEPKRSEPTACYLAVEMRKGAPKDGRITDADRQKWKGWASSGGMNRVVAARDAKIAGYPAFETVSKADEMTIYRVFVLMDSPARLIDFTYLASWGRKDHYERYKPAIDAALATLSPAGGSGKASRGK